VCSPTLYLTNYNGSVFLGSVRRCAFTLIELLVVIAIVAILSAMLLAVLTQVRERGNTTQCLSWLKRWDPMPQHIPRNSLTESSRDTTVESICCSWPGKFNLSPVLTLDVGWGTRDCPTSAGLRELPVTQVRSTTSERKTDEHWPAFFIQ